MVGKSRNRGLTCWGDSWCRDDSGQSPLGLRILRQRIKSGVVLHQARSEVISPPDVGRQTGSFRPEIKYRGGSHE